MASYHHSFKFINLSFSHSNPRLLSEELPNHGSVSLTRKTGQWHPFGFNKSSFTKILDAFFSVFPKHTSKILWLHILLEEKIISSQIERDRRRFRRRYGQSGSCGPCGASTAKGVPQAPRNQEMMMVLAMMVDHPLKQFYQKYTRRPNEIDMSTWGFFWLGRTSSTKLPDRGWVRLPRFIQHRLIF